MSLADINIYDWLRVVFEFGVGILIFMYTWRKGNPVWLRAAGVMGCALMTFFATNRILQIFNLPNVSWF